VVNVRVGAFMKNPPAPVKKQIRQELSKEIRRGVPKRNKAIKGTSHNELVRQAERIIY